MTAKIELYDPEGLGAPLGLYRQVARVRADETLFVAGQLATDANGGIVGKGDFDAQLRQVFANIGAALKSAGAGFGNVVQFTTYLARAGHRELHAREEGALPAPVPRSRLSAQHAARGRPAGEGGIPRRSADRRGDLTRGVRSRPVLGRAASTALPAPSCIARLRLFPWLRRRYATPSAASTRRFSFPAARSSSFPRRP